MGLLHRLLFPPRCAACGEFTDWYVQSPALCESCEKAWNNEKGDVCSICGERVSVCSCMTEEMKRAKCASFRKLVYYYPHKRSTVQNRILFSIKEKKLAASFSFLANELRALVEAIKGEATADSFCIVYLPRTKEQKRKYGLDQAEMLARALSKRTQIPLVPAIRRVGGIPQKDLSGLARIRNAKQSFAVAKEADVRGKTVLLLDDVVTTGAGMSAGARLLRAQGAVEVHCIAIATDACNREVV